MSYDDTEPRERQISRDEETIRQWADEHDAGPVRESGTGGDTESYRLVPEAHVQEGHERVEWDTFFDDVETSDRIVLYHGQDARDPFEVSRHSEVVSDEEIENRLLEGETVTTEVTETRVVESVVVEEVTVDSELVDSEIVDYDVVDVELLGRDVTNVDVVDDETTDSREWFDAERYTAMLRDRMVDRERTESAQLDRDVPYHVEFDVEEHWAVTMDLVERFDVESHVSDTDVTEADTIEDHDVDVEGLHRSIIESGVIQTGDRDRTTEEAVTHYDIESELAETDRITTSFTRERRIEDEVLDRKHMTAEVASAELVDMETVSTREVESATEGTATETAAATGGPETMEADETGAGGGASPTTLDDDALGKTVVDASGTEVGMVSDVHDDGTTVAVDTHPSITDRIRTTLGWGETGEDDYPLSVDQVEEVTSDEIRLKSEEHLGTGHEH